MLHINIASISGSLVIFPRHLAVVIIKVEDSTKQGNFYFLPIFQSSWICLDLHGFFWGGRVFKTHCLISFQFYCPINKRKPGHSWNFILMQGSIAFWRSFIWYIWHSLRVIFKMLLSYYGQLAWNKFLYLAEALFLSLCFSQSDKWPTASRNPLPPTDFFSPLLPL